MFFAAMDAERQGVAGNGHASRVWKGETTVFGRALFVPPR